MDLNRVYVSYTSSNEYNPYLNFLYFFPYVLIPASTTLENLVVINHT